MIRQAFGGIWIPAPMVRMSGARSKIVTCNGGIARRHAIAHARPPIPAPTMATRSSLVFEGS